MEASEWFSAGSLLVAVFAFVLAWGAERRVKKLEKAKEICWEIEGRVGEGGVEVRLVNVGSKAAYDVRIDSDIFGSIAVDSRLRFEAAKVESGGFILWPLPGCDPWLIPHVILVEFRRKVRGRSIQATVSTRQWRQAVESSIAPRVVQSDLFDDSRKPKE